jgi:staphylococcal nuclease domain-containing protein 1
MPEDQHQFANISLAGVRCPRAGGREGETAEEYGEEVSCFSTGAKNTDMNYAHILPIAGQILYRVGEISSFCTQYL